MNYDVSEILEDLKGHEGVPDRQIKIKLNDGTIKEIEGIQFLNACIGGDDVIYIKEMNPLIRDWGEGIKDFVNFANKIMSVCEKESFEHIDDDDYDSGDVIHIENEIAKLADFYIKKCNLQEKVKEEWGYYEVGAGETDEVYAKLKVLKHFINI